MLGRSSGIQAWLASLGMVPESAGRFSSAIGSGFTTGLDNTRRWKEDWNAKEQQKRDIETAKRRQRQSMGLSLGLGLGGAAAGAGVGALLAAPAGGISAGGGALAGTVPGSAAGNSIAGSNIGLPVDAPSGGQGFTSMPSPPQPMATGGQSYAPTQYGHEPFQQPGYGNNVPGVPQAGGAGSNRFGYLGNNRSQVFGNLFLQGAAGVIPGMGGVAQGINSANAMNYQMGRDATTDAFRGQQLGLQREGIGLDREQMAAMSQYRTDALGQQKSSAAESSRRFGITQKQRELEASQRHNLGMYQVGADIAGDFMRNMGGGGSGPNYPAWYTSGKELGFTSEELKQQQLASLNLVPDAVDPMVTLGRKANIYNTATRGLGGIAKSSGDLMSDETAGRLGRGFESVLGDVEGTPMGLGPPSRVSEFTQQEQMQIESLADETEKEKLRRMIRQRKGMR